MREDAVRIVQVEEVDESNGRMPPPIWVVVVVLAVVIGGWLLVTQGSDEASVVTTTTASPTADAAERSVFDDPPLAITAETPQQLRGYVAVTTPDNYDPPFSRDTVWVFRPGGSLVSRTDAGTGRPNAEYPMLITAGYLILDGSMVDIDLAEGPGSIWVDKSAIPGSGPGVVWPVGRAAGGTGNVLWVSRFDVESYTAGEWIDVTDLFDRPIVGVADGLIVVDLEEDLAFWSPTDGLVPLDLPGRPDVIAASGNFVVVYSLRRLNVLDIVSGEYVSSLEIPAFSGPVTSACLSPDGQHVIVVAINGEAVVGNITTGEVIDLNEVNDEFPIQREHGIGWTTDDQLVFIGDGEDAKNIVGFNVATGESFHVATLDGPGVWWLTASGTMC